MIVKNTTSFSNWPCSSKWYCWLWLLWKKSTLLTGKFTVEKRIVSMFSDFFCHSGYEESDERIEQVGLAVQTLAENAEVQNETVVDETERGVTEVFHLKYWHEAIWIQLLKTFGLSGLSSMDPKNYLLSKPPLPVWSCRFTFWWKQWNRWVRRNLTSNNDIKF